MKASTNIHFEVQDLKHYSGLCIGDNSSIESCLKGIERAVEGARARGYSNDEKWLVVEVLTCVFREDDDSFVSSIRDERAVAKYDNGMVTYLR